MVAKAYNTYIAPHAATAAAAALLCPRQSGRTVDRPYKLSPRPRIFTCNQAAIRSPGLPLNGLQPRNLCNYMD